MLIPSNKKKNKNSVVGCMVGGAIGDALGYQIEFETQFKEKQVTNFKNNKGVISDDTQMSMFTANALLNAKVENKIGKYKVDELKEIYYAYLTWFETQDEQYQCHSNIPAFHKPDSDSTGFWISDIHALYKRRAPGRTCLSALNKHKMGTVKKRVNISKGCGTVMRVAAIGLMENYAYSAGELAIHASAITHGHDLALIPSFVLSAMIFCLIRGYCLKSAFSASMTCLEYYQITNNVFDSENIDYAKRIFDKAIELSELNMNDTEAIKLIGDGWVAEETLAIALYSCFKYQNSFEDAIVCSVNHDGDSDSTGAVAGNIMGALLGVDNIPRYYIENVEMSEQILELANDMSYDFDNEIDKTMRMKYTIAKRG